MAARVAAELRKEDEVLVETVRGGLGEFSVLINDQQVVSTSRLWYPKPGKIVDQVRTLLANSFASDSDAK